MKKRILTMVLSICMISESFVFSTEAAEISAPEHTEEEVEEAKETEKIKKTEEAKEIEGAEEAEEIEETDEIRETEKIEETDEIKETDEIEKIKETEEIERIEEVKEEIDETKEIKETAEIQSNTGVSGIAVSKDWTWQYYENEDGTIEVTEYYRTSESNTMCDIVIPETIDGKTVVGVGHSYMKFNVSDKSKVRSITVPATVEEIALEAFEGFTSMTEITSLGNLSFYDLAWALKGCSSLKTITYGGEKEVYLKDLEGLPVTTINFLEGIEYVDVDNSIRDMSGIVEKEYLTTINLPSTVKSVRLGNLKHLQSINLPSNVEKIGFRDCPSLSTLNCTKPTTDMDVEWLENCPNLKIEVRIKEDGMPRINNAGITKLIIDGNAWSKYAWSKTSLSNCPNLKEIVVNGSNDYYFTKDGVLFWRKEKKDPYCDLIAYPAGKNPGSNYNVPENVRCIYYNAFNSCKCATITIPENITDEWYWNYGDSYTFHDDGSYTCHYHSVSFLTENQAKLRLVKGSCISSNSTEESVARTLRVSKNRIQFKYGNTYKISYKLNGGKNAAGNPTSYRAGEYIKLKNPTKKGYKFLGWKRNDGGSDNTTVRYKKFQDYTFTARWEKASDQAKITVTFHANGGKKLSKSSVKLKKNQAIGKMPTVQRKGYALKGWYTKKSGGTKISSSTKITKSQTLYAQWKKVTKPKKAVITSLKKKGKGEFTVKYKKASGAKGYQICYSTNKKFKSSVKKINAKSLSKTVKGLKKNKTYYVRIRAYKVDSAGNKVYGNYSKIKKVKV